MARIDGVVLLRSHAPRVVKGAARGSGLLLSQEHKEGMDG